jgi:phosphopantothenoylcysteine decarboxylase/phosphopantothenate--cysteine ligase
MLRGRMVVVGVSGGIAAYKACELVRSLQGHGASVVVAMSTAAAEFVSPLTFQTLSGNPVVYDLWGDQAPDFKLPKGSAHKMGKRVGHVDIAEIADCMVIAPATADLMARLVHGTAPDPLTVIALATPGPLLVCPSMDMQMWRKPSTQSNVRALRARGVTIVGPESGPLASGLSGPGRLADIDTIVEAVGRAVEKRASMQGLKVMVGAGRTEEPIDPVRVLTNRSSGRMGYALAEAARDRGAEVTLVTGPASIDAPHDVKLHRVRTAAEMKSAMTRRFAKADVVLMAAAVSDYRVRRSSKEKIKRSTERLTLELVPNPDIIASLGAKRRKGQTLVGFALETSQGIQRARAKLKEKNLDLVVLNAPEFGIGSETNKVTLVEARTQKRLPEMTKREVAERILDRVLEMRERGSNR